jgi:tRNA pseudouridine38-40 synthase
LAKYALGVEYLGTHYCGWQRQSHCDSVQGYLEKALSSIANKAIDLHCAGRTDTGVHALGQVVHFETEVERPLKAWVQGVNTQLPGDIRVAWVKEVEPGFHARFTAFARQYRYVIYNRAVHSAALFQRVAFEPFELDEDKMNLAAQALIGEQDFSSFRASQCQAQHARREVQYVEVTRKGNMVFIDIRANAFLHHMVRNIVGSLIEVGRGRQSVDWIAELLAKQDRTLAAPTAPASGLYFVNAFYPKEYAIPLVEIDEVLWQ